MESGESSIKQYVNNYNVNSYYKEGFFSETIMQTKNIYTDIF